LSEHEFCERLLVEEHVAVIPGSAFGAGGEGHIRCAYASSLENIEKALERMDRFMRRTLG
jgi:aminotransferase